MAEQTYPVMGNTPKPPVPATVDAAALPTGHKVLEYGIEKLLGGGGFGLTYLARDINLELPVALKEYFPGDLATRSADQSVQVRSVESSGQFALGLERFLDEARALASFRHPNITRVLRYFRENGTAYIVMEYETGDPLKLWLARQDGLSRKSLLQLVYPLMDGLEAVHRMGFLHRDIKPDNIYIRADGSPVLLDFGSARRVSAERDMTSIVSPGFAPFEQYHRQGKQGPWTDIYALGAVMYWMTTGQKPLESASRVKQDSMPRAVEAGHPAFGESLLRAIDWAMHPDEALRPQDVAGFRAALTGSENRPSHPGGEVQASAVFASNTPSFAHNQADAQPKNMLGTIMFLGMAAYSGYPAAQQAIAKTRFNELLAKALKGLPESSRIVIDSGDGAAVCFLGDPEEALQSALLLRGLLLQKYRRALAVRTGLHMGPIRLVFDSNNRVGVVGDGINVAQRVMDFAKVSQIVASRAYYDVVSHITDLAASQFKPLGTHLDKHLRSHEIYAVLDPQSAPARPSVTATSAFENTASYATLASLTPEMAAEIETELARLIGPLARVLVKKAMSRTVSAQSLRDLLSVSIPDPVVRELFVKPKSSKSQPSSQPGPHPGVSSGFSSLHANAGQPASGHSGPMSLPLSSPYFSTAQLLQLERALSQYIGPLAKMIVKKEAAKTVSLEALRQALAGHVDRPADRAKLLAAVQNIQ